MKKLLLLLTALFVAANMANASPPDSCLKMIWDNDYHIDSWGNYLGNANQDSVKADSCIGSPTYQKLFAKKYFILRFETAYYPFDHVLKHDSMKVVDDISISKSKMKQSFKNLEIQYGKIYFRGLRVDYADSILIRNPAIMIYFENYQDITDIEATFITQIDSLLSIKYDHRAKQLTSSISNGISEIMIEVYPNPTESIIKIVSCLDLSGEQVEIYNTMGNKVYENSFTPKIDATFLPSGIYFIKIGNKFSKFIKE